MRVLVYRLGSLGDTVLALPCFHLIREAFPNAQVTVLTNAPVSGKAAPLEAVLGSSGLVDEVLHYPVGLRDMGELKKLRDRLRAEKFNVVISLAASRGLVASLRDLLFFRACGIPRTIGFPFKRLDLASALRADQSGLYESEADRLLRRISRLGTADLADRKWFNLHLTAAEREDAVRLLLAHHLPEKFIAASLGTKTQLNDWGTENWSNLLHQLSARHPDLGVVLLGSADESVRSQALLESWTGPSANLCGQASPRVSAALFEGASAYIGHDSGPMHLAAAAGVRCVGIFSARCPPGQWFPLGRGHTPLYPSSFYDPTLINDLGHQKRALASIKVADVLAAVETILRDSP